MHNPKNVSAQPGGMVGNPVGHSDGNDLGHQYRASEAAASDQPHIQSSLPWFELHELGFVIFPLLPRSKIPAIPWKLFQSSPPTRENIAGWVSHQGNLGVITGRPSGIVVLDADTPEAIAYVNERGLPTTFSVTTARGKHYYLRHPGWAVPTRLKIEPGWDLKGEGGYVVGPGSVHPNGTVYRATLPITSTPIAEMPDWLCEIAFQENQRPSARKLISNPGANGSQGFSLEQACNDIVTAPWGQQETVLNSSSFRAGLLVGSGRVEIETAYATLLNAAMTMESFEPDRPWTEPALNGKIRSAIDAGIARHHSDQGSNPHFFDKAKGSVGGSEGAEMSAQTSGPESVQKRKKSSLSANMANNTAQRSLKPKGPKGGLSRQPVIKIQKGKVHQLASEAEQALIRYGAHIYQRNGLVKPIFNTTKLPATGELVSASIVPVDEATLVDYMSRAAKWEKLDGRTGRYVTADPPRDVAKILLSRSGEWHFLPLIGVITVPTIRPDGSLLDIEGYDPATQLLLKRSISMPEIPASPTRQDALEALESLKELISGFPFVDDAAESVALAALITVVTRGGFATSPAIVIMAPTPGTGKSYLVDLCSILATGLEAAAISPGQREEETEKRISSVLQDGRMIIALDNINGPLGGDQLCQLIERPLISVRELGKSSMPPRHNTACVFITGNNVQILGDLTRRVIISTLDAKVERPELRSFEKKPHEELRRNRGHYISAVLTIVRAYVVAGCPNPCAPLGSFEGWSRYVRSSLVWLGCSDPVSTMAKARENDPVTTTLSKLFAELHSAGGATARTVGEIKKLAEEVDGYQRRLRPSLFDVLVDVAAGPRSDIESRRLGKYLSQYEGRIVGNLRLVGSFDTHSKQKIWKIDALP